MSNSESTRRAIEEELLQLRQEVAELTSRLQDQHPAQAGNDSQGCAAALFTAIYGQSSQLGGIIAMDGTLQQANRAACELIGCDPSQVVGKLVWETPWWSHSTEERHKLRDGIARALVGEPIQFETTHLAADGQLHYFDFSLKPVRDQRGELLCLIAEAWDKTDRKRAEERNRDRDSMLQGVYRATPVGISFSIDRVIVSVNESMSAITGFRDRELVGHSARILYVTQEEFELVGRALYPQDPKTWPVTVETRLQRKDGAIISVILTAALLRLEDSVTGFVVTVQDITERKSAEQALQESEGRFRSIMQQSPFSVQVFSPRGDMIDANKAFEQLWGINKESLIGWYNVLKDEQIRKLGMMPAVERGFAGEIVSTSIVDYDSVATAGEGNRRIVQGDLYPIRGAHGEIRLVILIHQDISERRRAELERNKLQEQLQQAMKMEAVGRLAGGVAHDFNNLLTSITGNVDLARMDLDITDPTIQFLDEIERAARSAASLTRQLLAFSRQQIIEPKVVNLNDLVERMHKMLLRLVGEDVELKANFDQNLDSVMVDPGQFEQVLANLVVNARDAMPDGGKLQIDTMNIDLDLQYCSLHPQVQPGRYVALVVSDTGQGMSEQVKQQVFEPFFTTKPKGIGTGLGLATAFGTVKQAGGTIEVYSEVGLGTTFKIYLPRVETPARKLNDSRSASKLARGNETIFVVEDNDSVRSFVQELLRRLGYTVLCASNGPEALLTTEKSKEAIDLLLTDVVMPGMSGRELAERLLQGRPGIKVLFTSGYTENVIVHHGVLEEKINFIGKPYSMQTLAAKIRDVLDT